MKTIIIVGCGIMQIPAFQAAREEGWKTIGVDGDKNAPAAPMADIFWHIDLKDRIGLAEKALQWVEKNPVEGVFTAGTDFSATVAWVAEKLGLPGIPYQTALNASDKIRMRTCFKNGGLKTPLFWEIGGPDELEQYRKEIKYPVVAKPADSMGARGVRRIDDFQQLKQWLNQCLKYSISGRIIIEEYLPGPEFSLDALIYNNRIQICGVADREIILPPYFVEKGHQFPSKFSRGEVKEIIHCFKEGIKALDLTLGAAKGDIKLTPQGPVIGEIAARLSGGFMSGWTFPYATGKNPVKEAMKIALSIEPEFWGDVTETPCAERAVISIPGRIKSVESIDEAYEMEGVKDIILLSDQGDDVRFPVNNVEKTANIIAVPGNGLSAIENAESAANKIIFRLEINQKETLDYLEHMDQWPGPFFSPIPMELTDFIADFSILDSNQHLKDIHLPSQIYLKSKDLMNRSLSSQLELLQSEYQIEYIDGEMEKIDKLFWHVLFRGGIQGARWFLDHFRLDSK